nr:transposase (putative), gypsy type [Tanacetum cinerariifolium]
MSTIRDIKSKLNQKALDAQSTKYHIPACVHPVLPGPDKNILRSPDGKIGVYNWFFDFANYRVPLSQFLVDVLDHFHIHLSQLSVFGAAKVDSTSFPLSVSVKSKILSKDPPPKPSRNDTEACEFFRTHTALFRKFSEPFLCWVGISRYYTLEMDLFAFIRHSDPTKVQIGERELTEREVGLLKMTEVRTVPLTPPITTPPEDSGDSIDKDANGSAYPPKKLRGDHQSLLLNFGGKYLADLSNMVPAGSAIPSGATKPLIAAFVAPVSDARPLDSVSGANLRTCPPHVRYVVSSDGSCHSDSYPESNSFVRSSVVDVSVVTVIVTTTVDADVTAGSKTKDVSKDFENIRDSTSACGINADATNILRLKKTSTSSDSFYASKDLYVCRDLTDRLAPPGLFAQLRAMDYDQLYSEYNVGAAWQVCLEWEVKMRATHFGEKSQLSVMETADAAKSTKLRDLKEKNFALEGERSALPERVTTLESVTASKEAELTSLSSQVAKLTADLFGFQLSHDELNSKLASLEFERYYLAAQKSSLEYAFELFMERIEALQDEQAKDLGDRVAKLDTQLRWFLSHELKLVILKCLQSPEYRQALGWAIGCAVNKGIQDGLKAGTDHGKVRRHLFVVVAYDPFVEEKYVDAVNALGAVDFSMLFELESKKDSSIVDLWILFAWRALWQRSQGRETHSLLWNNSCFPEEDKEKHLLLTDVMTPFVEPLSSKSLTGEASTFAAPITTLSITFASSAIIPHSLVVSDQDLDAETHNEDPPAMTFKKEELSTSPE